MCLLKFNLLLSLICQVNLQHPSNSKQLQILFNPLEATKLFSDFVNKYKKEYKTSYEFERRLKIFRGNIAEISRRNMRSESTVFGVTPFMDLSNREMENILNKGCFRSPKFGSKVLGSYHLGSVDERENLTDWDWRRHHAVTPVRDQGDCGASWAFSAVASIESRYAIKYKRLKNLSTQQVLDCTGNSDCNGGYSNDAVYLNTVNFGGLLSEKRRPYVGVKNKCNITGIKQSAKLVGVSPFAGSEENLTRIVSGRGPVIASLEVNTAFLTYKGGIATADDLDCEGLNVLHCVAIIGFGIDKDTGVPFWIIKNSFGKDWGENGYFRLIRGQNACGIVNQVIEPFVN